MGFSDESAERQLALEEKFDSLLDTSDIEAWIQRMSARPHHVGSPYGKDNAEFLLELFRSWGWEAEIETYWVLFPTPEVRLVEMIEPHSYRASLAETSWP